MPATVSSLLSWLRDRSGCDRGASLVEYVLLVALIAIVCLVAIQFLGVATSESLDTSGSAVGSVLDG